MSQQITHTVGGLLDDMARRYPDNDALVYPERGLRYSYRQFNEVCRQVAKGLLRLGIKKGDNVSIWAYNVPEWVILQFATAKIGAVLVTINTSYKSAELEYILNQSDSTTLFMVRSFKDSDYVATVTDVIPGLASAEPGSISTPKLPFMKNVVFIGEDTPAGMMNFNRIMELGVDVPDSELAAIEATLDCHETINMQYTSGTTGFPKGVMLTHYNIVNNGFNIGECMKFTPDDRLCIPVPFFHCFGCVLGVMACVTHATAMVPVEIFDPLKVLQTIEKEKCTAVHGVPTMFIAELEHPEFPKFDLSSLRTGIMAGSPCPIEVMKKVISRMNASEITIAYGQTESSPVITQTRTDDPLEKRVTTVGQVHPHVEVKVIDPTTGRIVPRGTPGELCTRGYSVMVGYWADAHATKQAIDEGRWMHTGDLATMDAEGYVNIVGRIKDMVLRGGENVFPREVEEFLGYAAARRAARLRRLEALPLRDAAAFIQLLPHLALQLFLNLAGVPAVLGHQCKSVDAATRTTAAQLQPPEGLTRDASAASSCATTASSRKSP